MQAFDYRNTAMRLGFWSSDKSGFTMVANGVVVFVNAVLPKAPNHTVIVIVKWTEHKANGWTHHSCCRVQCHTAASLLRKPCIIWVWRRTDGANGASQEGWRGLGSWQVGGGGAFNKRFTRNFCSGTYMPRPLIKHQNWSPQICWVLIGWKSEGQFLSLHY